MSVKRKKRHTGWKIFFIIIAVCLVIGVIFWKEIKATVSERAAEAVVEKLMEDKINSDTAVYGNLTAKDIYDSMDTSDKQAVTDIITKNMTPEKIKDVEGYVTSGDTAGLKQYVKDNLSSEDTQTIENMYEKYKNQLDSTEN